MAIGVVEQLTGKKGDEAVSMVGADPALQVEFKRMLLKDKHVAEEMRYADRKDAREMYKHHHGMQDDVAKSIMKWNLPGVFILVLLNAAVMIFIPSEYAAAGQAIGTLMGFVINQLLKERQDLIGFNFGSSTGSKLKD